MAQDAAEQHNMMIMIQYDEYIIDFCDFDHNERASTFFNHVRHKVSLKGNLGS